MLLALVLLVAQGVPDAQAIAASPTSPGNPPLVVLASNSILPPAPSSLLPPRAEANPHAAIRPEVAIVPVQRPTRDRAPAARRGAWLGLTIALHSSAAFDAWTTRRRIGSGGYHETNPLLRPFAGNSSLYAVTQVTPAMLDFVGNRMRHSDRTWVRRLWWAPQAFQTTTHLVCGARNLTK